MTTNKTLFTQIQDILVEILDIEPEDIRPETYVSRELDAESIDLLELAVLLNTHFNITIHDEDIFLRNLRIFLTEADTQNMAYPNYLKTKYPFLSDNRIGEILTDLEDGPVLKVVDIINYIDFFSP